MALPQSQILDYLYAHMWDENAIGPNDGQIPRRLFRYATHVFSREVR